jgi:hypothetical protein
MAAFGVEQIQNGGGCHGNQGAKNVKFTPNFTNFCSNASCHIHIFLPGFINFCLASNLL